MEAKEESSWNQPLFWIALTSSYFTYGFSPLLLISLPFWLVVVFIFFRKKTRWRWYLIAFSFWLLIPTLNFMKGTIGYLTGNARLISVGYPMYTLYNLDNEYRVHRESSGCIAFGLEPLTQEPNNFAIRSLTYLFGYERGTYTGFYPDKDDTEKIIQTKSKLVDIKKVDSFLLFTAGNKNLSIIPSFRRDDDLFNNCTKAKVAVVDDKLIILRPLTDDKERSTYLADKDTGKIFACYRNY